MGGNGDKRMTKESESVEVKEHVYVNPAGFTAMGDAVDADLLGRPWLWN